MNNLMNKLGIFAAIILIIIPPFALGFCVSEESMIGEIIMFAILIAEIVFLFHNINYYMCLENEVEALEKALEGELDYCDGDENDE